MSAVECTDVALLVLDGGVEVVSTEVTIVVSVTVVVPGAVVDGVA